MVGGWFVLPPMQSGLLHCFLNGRTSAMYGKGHAKEVRLHNVCVHHDIQSFVYEQQLNNVNNIFLILSIYGPSAFFIAVKKTFQNSQTFSIPNSLVRLFKIKE